MKLGGGCLQHACLFSWISTPLAGVSRSAIVNSHPLDAAAALPCSLAQICPDRDTNGTTQLAQLEFMTSYRCGPPVRPSYSLHAGRCSDITSPSAGPLMLKHCAIFSFYPWAGAWPQCEEVRQVNSRFLRGICICGRKCPWARHISCTAKGTAGRTDEGMGSGWRCLKSSVVCSPIWTVFTLKSTIIRTTLQTEV